MTFAEIPDYLRLHVEEPLEAPLQQPLLIPRFPELQAGFEAATGWSLRLLPGGESDLGAAWSAPVHRGPSEESCRMGLFARHSGEPDAAPTPLPRVQLLVEGLHSVLNELQRTRRTLWQREAELATGVPVIRHPQEAEQLTLRLESVLRAAATSVGCEAAALYVLNDATTELKLSAVWGLPRDRLLEPARPLRGAFADLEALLGHAVAVEDTSQLPHWQIPENFASAVCVPVSSPTMPLGTLWLFHGAPRDFTPQETQILELAAGRLAADLERHMMLEDVTRSRRADRQVERAAQRQMEWLPQDAPLVEGWEFAAACVQADAAGGDFFQWRVLPDGDLGIWVGDADGSGHEAAQTAALLYATSMAHAAYRHRARQLLERVGETLWSSTLGDQTASLAYAKIHPERGDLDFAGTGRVTALLLRGKKWQVLPTQDAALGAEMGPAPRGVSRRLSEGDTLLLLSSGVLETRNASGERLRVEDLVPHVQGANRSADQILGAVCNLLEAWGGTVPTPDRTIVVVRRAEGPAGAP